MSKEFLTFCDDVIKNNQSKRYGKRKFRDELVDEFINKNKIQILDIISKVKNEKEKLKDIEKEKQRINIIDYLKKQFKDDDFDFSNLYFEIDNEGEFHESNRFERISSHESRDDIKNEYPDSLEWGLSIEYRRWSNKKQEYIKTPIFYWSYNGIQNIDIGSDRVYFDEPEANLDLDFCDDEIEKVQRIEKSFNFL